MHSKFKHISLIFIVQGFFLFSFGSEVVRESFQSKILKKNMSYNVFLPKSYKSENQNRFPVVYLLHCYGGSPDIFLINDYCDGLLNALDTARFIIVSPYDGTGGKWWVDSRIDTISRMSTFLVSELKPRIDSLYRTLSNKENTGVAGHSMGGFGSLHFVSTYPSIFTAAYSIKGCIKLNSYPNNWELQSVFGPVNSPSRDPFDLMVNIERFRNLKAKLYITTGTEDFFSAENEEFHQKLTQMGVAHTFKNRSGEGHGYISNLDVRDMVAFFSSSFSFMSNVKHKKSNLKKNSNQKKNKSSLSLDGKKVQVQKECLSKLVAK